MLWLRQQQCCAMCRYRITKTTGWDIHYIVERVKSGSDELSSSVLSVLTLIVISNCMIRDNNRDLGFLSRIWNNDRKHWSQGLCCLHREFQRHINEKINYKVKDY